MMPKTIYSLFLLLVFTRASFANCVPPSDLGDGIVIPTQQVYSLWSRVVLSCPLGFTSTGPEYTYCVDDNVWNPRPDEFKCLARCNGPEVTSDVVHFPRGLDSEHTQASYDNEAVIEYACANREGATLMGPAEATCMKGAWAPPSTPTCNGCDQPRVSEAGTVRVIPLQETYSAYSFVTLSCSDDVMYTAKGPNVTYCETNGEWLPDPRKMNCHENCLQPIREMPVMSYPHGGTPDDAKKVYKYNEIVQNACLYKKTLVGPRIQKCVDGIWLPDIYVSCT